MQRRILLFTVIMGCSFGLLAQTSNRKIAHNTSSTSSAEEVDFVLGSNTKIVKPDSIVSQQDPIPSVPNSPSPISNKYKPVPLIGAVDYYGAHHNTIISYTTNYMKNFGGRIGRNTNKEQIFTTIDGILDHYEIPRELKYLAVIESALNGNARSKAGAVGYWQFMAPTARDMGLVVNKNRDDRRHLNKSTEAAAKYLTYLYNQLDDWLLVIAAYNCGPRPVLNAINRTGKNDFWTIKPYLPRETQNHVLAFIATATIMERLDAYIEPGLPSNFDWATLNHKAGQLKNKEATPENALLTRFGKEELQKMAIIRINKPMQFEQIASLLAIDISLLNRWNYDYLEFYRNYEQGATYNLKIPKEKLESFLKNKAELEKNQRF